MHRKSFMALCCFAIIVFCAIYACASGPERVTFNQGLDCTDVSGWELAYERSTAAQPSASATIVPLTTTTVTCGVNQAETVPVTGIAGPTRFWLRARTASGTRSPWSNFVDAVVPLGAPVLVSVG